LFVYVIVLYLVCAGFVIGRCAVKLYFAVAVASLREEVKLLEGHVAIRCTSFPNVVVDHILPLFL
jgi:hypothetical protein